MKLKSIASVVIPAVALLASSSAMAAPATLGALFSFNGTLIGSGPVSGDIYDGAIHSGVFGVANGTPSDSYVLQGGDPFGGDTGDAYEVAQAPGHANVAGFDIWTSYAFGQPASQVGTFIFASPDTGVLTFVNSTPFEFVGTLKLAGQAFGGIYGPAQFFSNSGAVDLLPGASANILLNNESSNYGGYNHPDVVPDAGATAAMLAMGVTGLAGMARRMRKA